MSTPKTPSNNSPTNSQFSPITVAESPVKKILQCGNLTGNRRRVRDLVADLHSFIQDWNAQHLLGYQLLNNIMELKIPVLTDGEAQEISNVYPENLQEHCEQLDEVVINLSEIVLKLHATLQQMLSVEKLEDLQNVKKAPLFLTWPVTKYGEVIDKIYNAYKRELQAKRIVKESIAHSSTKQELMYYIITWTYQPYIDSQIEFLLESLLQETGHR